MGVSHRTRTSYSYASFGQIKLKDCPISWAKSFDCFLTFFVRYFRLNFKNLARHFYRNLYLAYRKFHFPDFYQTPYPIFKIQSPYCSDQKEVSLFRSLTWTRRHFKTFLSLTRSLLRSLGTFNPATVHFKFITLECYRPSHSSSISNCRFKSLE